jgi:hypothetical protein
MVNVHFPNDRSESHFKASALGYIRRSDCSCNQRPFKESLTGFETWPPGPLGRAPMSLNYLATLGLPVGGAMTAS